MRLDKVKEKSLEKDVAVIGGGIGGVLGALTAAKEGFNVVLTEESEWIGGQLTSQAVPPDEHPWIEEFGCTKTYRDFRNKIRDYYKEYYPLKKTASDIKLNPGNAWVSHISHEPKISLKILYNFLQPYLTNGRIEIILQSSPVKTFVTDDKITKLIMKDNKNNKSFNITADYFLDATETGELLPLAGVEYTIGAEKKSETGELNALNEEDPTDVQPITHVFAVEFRGGENHTIKKPEMYDFWSNYKPKALKGKKLFSEYLPDPETGNVKYIPLRNKNEKLGLWEYRRIIDKSIYKGDFFDGDISLINWPQNDYMLGTIIDVDEKIKEKRLKEAKQLSLSLLYWLQTEAPREGGLRGYPELKLRPDITGTEDGLAMCPYIRESRRIKSIYTITEKDVSVEIRGDKGSEFLDDSVGIGSYAIDLHPTTVNQRVFYAETYPFEIPLASFIPVGIENLIPSCKNIGTTQLTNGCFRLHPVEWNIGEVAGSLAAFSIKNNISPRKVYKNKDYRKEFQKQLDKVGIERHWPDYFYKKND